MKYLPTDPHAIIEIRPPGGGGVGHLVWDSWEQKRLFKSVEVDLVTNESSQLTWQFFDPNFHILDAFAGTSPVPMSTVRAYLGHGRDLGEPLFKGLLAEVERT